jgi:peptide subunit release factor 1 (eRF1)
MKIGARDLERLRENLTISALGRVRLIVESEEGKLSIQMECISCEELLEWDSKKRWWACPACRQETTEQEAGDLFSECHRALGIVMDGRTTDDGKGAGRWADRLRGLMGS